MKYKTMTEILEDKNLDLTAMNEAIWQFLEEKGLSMEEFMETEEGQRLMELSDKARFADPFPYEAMNPKQC